MLRETEALFRTTVENLPINLVLYDRDYRILYMNPALATICARRSAGGRRMSWWACAARSCGRRRSGIRCTSTPSARSRRASARPTSSPPNIPGRGPSVREWTVVPLVGPDGEIDRILAMSHDVTAQRQMVEALREADQRKSEFIAVLSHELRNPLAAIRTQPPRARARRAGQRRGGRDVAHDHRSPGRPAGPPGRRSAGRHAHHPEQDPAAAAAARPQRAGARDARGQPRAPRAQRRARRGGAGDARPST